MKKSILVLVIILLITGTLLMGCSSPGEKVAEAESNVAVANINLEKANEAYLADIDKYRKETADKIAANQKSITEFRARVAKEKTEVRTDYNNKLDALEKKNTDMQKSLDDYKADGKDKWETFKNDFSRSMDEFGNSFKDLTDKKAN